MAIITTGVGVVFFSGIGVFSGKPNYNGSNFP